MSSDGYLLTTSSYRICQKTRFTVRAAPGKFQPSASHLSHGLRGHLHSNESTLFYRDIFTLPISLILMTDKGILLVKLVCGLGRQV